MRKDLIPVIQTMREIAQRSRVKLDFEPRQGAKPCRHCGGYECNAGQALLGSRTETAIWPDGAIDTTIILSYDELTTTPEEMFWVFGHELGHAMQHKRKAFLTNSTSDKLNAEIDAWNYAQALANISAWPINERFWEKRAWALGTHGIVADERPLVTV